MLPVLNAVHRPTQTSSRTDDRPAFAMATPESSPLTPSFVEHAEEHDGGTQWFYVDRSGTRRGPHNFRILRAQMRCGVLCGDDLVWRDGLAEWCPAKDFPVFAMCVDGVVPAVATNSGDTPRDRDGDAAPSDRGDAEATGTSSFQIEPTQSRNTPKPNAHATTSVPHVAYDSPGPDDHDDSWHASRSDGTTFGPVVIDTLVTLLSNADAVRASFATSVETLVWHPSLQPGWGPASECTALLVAQRRAAHKPHPPWRPPPITSPHKVGSSETEERSARPETSALLELLALRDAELLELRDLLDRSRFQNDVLEAELEVTRERTAEAAAFASAAAGAEAAAVDLATARTALTVKTAELKKLQGVLKGKLLARVLAEVGETKNRIGVLDETDENAGGGGTESFD